ncbi:hypothetical protein P7C73_g3785, partial [Tremellales sp. Uapishka_1]
MSATTTVAPTSNVSTTRYNGPSTIHIVPPLIPTNNKSVQEVIDFAGYEIRVTVTADNVVTSNGANTSVGQNEQSFFPSARSATAMMGTDDDRFHDEVKTRLSSIYDLADQDEDEIDTAITALRRRFGDTDTTSLRPEERDARETQFVQSILGELLTQKGTPFNATGQPTYTPRLATSQFGSQTRATEDPLQQQWVEEIYRLVDSQCDIPWNKHAAIRGRISEVIDREANNDAYTSNGQITDAIMLSVVASLIKDRVRERRGSKFYTSIVPPGTYCSEIYPETTATDYLKEVTADIAQREQLNEPIDFLRRYGGCHSKYAQERDPHSGTDAEWEKRRYMSRAATVDQALRIYEIDRQLAPAVEELISRTVSDIALLPDDSRPKTGPEWTTQFKSRMDSTLGANTTKRWDQASSWQSSWPSWGRLWR